MIHYQDIERIDDLSKVTRHRIFTLFDEAFPPAEMPLEDELYAHMHGPAHSAIMAWTDGQTLAGVLFHHDGDLISPELAGVRYISFLAVNRVLRGHGVGGDLLDYFVKQHAGERIVLYAEASDTPEAKRRLDFYARHGFRPSDVKHVMPSCRPGYEPEPFYLLAYGEQIPDEVAERMCTAIDAFEQGEGEGSTQAE